MKNYIEAKLLDENLTAAIMIDKIIYVLKNSPAGTAIVFLDGIEPRSLQLEMTYEDFLEKLR